jgi:hypothetical protein
MSIFWCRGPLWRQNNASEMMGMYVAIMQPLIMFVCALHMPTEKMNCVDKTLHLDVGM